jgi:hypothetical protein
VLVVLAEVCWSLLHRAHKSPPQIDHLKPIFVPAGYDHIKDIGTPRGGNEDPITGMMSWQETVEKLFPSNKQVRALPNNCTHHLQQAKAEKNCHLGNFRRVKSAFESVTLLPCEASRHRAIFCEDCHGEHQPTLLGHKTATCSLASRAFSLWLVITALFKICNPGLSFATLQCPSHACCQQHGAC